MRIKFLSLCDKEFDVDAKAGCLESEPVEADPRCVKRSIEVLFTSRCWGEMPGAKAIALDKTWWVVDAKLWPSRHRVCCSLERIDLINGCRVQVGHLVKRGFECAKSEWLEEDGCCDAIVTLDQTRLVEKNGAKFNEQIYKVKIAQMFEFTTDHVIKVEDHCLKVSKILQGPKPGGLVEIEAVRTNHPRA